MGQKNRTLAEPLLGRLCPRFVRAAPLANAVELNSVSGDRELRLSADTTLKRSVDRNLEIINSSASVTDKVIVRPYVGFEPIVGASEVDLLDKSLLHQDRQIPIHGSHAQTRELVFQSTIDPVGRRVATRALQQLEYPLALSAPFVLAVSFYCRAPAPIIGIIPILAGLGPAVNTPESGFGRAQAENRRLARLPASIRFHTMAER